MVKELPRCDCCGALLSWPFIQWNPREYQVFSYIRDCSPRSSKAIAKALKMEDNTVRGIISRIRKRLPDDVEILERPYRVVRIVSWVEDGRQISAKVTEIHD